MDDNSMVKIMQSLGLDYSPAILSTKQFEQSIESLNKQLLGMKGIAIQTAKDVSNAFSSQMGGAVGSKTIVDQYGNAFKTIQNESVKMSESHIRISNAAKQHSQSVEDVKNQYDMLGNEFQRRASWFITGGMFYGGIKAAKETVSSIKDVEMGMVEIARVMEDSTFRFNGYRDQLLQLGVDYGQSFDNVQDIALRWAQAGYNVKDSLDLTRTSLLALNTAELDASNATESMIGIMSQWNMTASELPLLMDKINKTGDDFTVTSQDLVDGLLRSSSAAKIMNMNVDETIALLTVMREASGRTGREVGNALNSILSYIQRPKSIDTLESMGITVFADEAGTQFRNVMEIFQDVASKWNTASDEIKDGFVSAADDAGLFSEELATALGLQEEWNDIQARDIAQASAGVYRRNYYIGMIERLSNAQNVLNGLTNAAGYSQSENARTMDTLEKKYQSLQTSVTQLAVALGDAGLLDVLKNITDSAVSVTQAIGNVDDEGKALILTVLEITAAVTALKGVAGLFTTKNILFGTAEAAALLPGWLKLLAIIPAVIAGISLYNNNLNSAKFSSDDFIKKQQTLVKNYESQVKATEETAKIMEVEAKTAELLADKLETLNQKESLNVSEKAQLKDITEKLNSTFPQLGLAIDEQTGKVIGNTSAIYDNIAALREQAIAQAYQAKMQATATAYVEQEMLLGQTKSEIDLAKGDIVSLSGNKFNNYQDYLAEAAELKSKAEMQNWGKRTLTLRQLELRKKYGIVEAETEINKRFDEVNSLEKLATEQEVRLKELDDELQDWMNKAVETASNVSKTDYVPSTSSPKSGSTSGSTYKNPALSEALKVLDYKKYINKLTTEEEIATLNEIKANHVKTADELMDINKRIYSAEKQLEQDKKDESEKTYKEEINNIQYMARLGIYSVQQQIDAFKELYSIKIDGLDNEQERIENLFSLYKQLLSEEQKKIKDAYDERLKLIDEEADKKKKARQDEISDLQEQLKLLDRKDNQRSYEQTIADLKQQIEYWSVRTSEEARKKVVELEQQIDEEKYKHQLEQQKQSLNDKIDVLEDEIDEIEATANEEKKKWEKSYKQIEKAFDSHSANIVALAGAMSKEAYEQWVNNYLNPLQEALAENDYGSFDSISGGLSGSIGDLDNKAGNSSNAKIYQAAKSILSLKKQWTDGDMSAADKAVQYYNQLRNLGSTGQTVADYLNTANYESAKNYVNNLPKMHSGGKTLSYGAVYMKPGELTFPPDLSKGLERLFPLLSNLAKSGNMTYDQKKEIKIDRLVNIENNRMEDNADEQSFAREINRVLNSVF